MVRVGVRRVAIANCHLSAAGASGGMAGGEKRGMQYREMDAELGKKLAGCACPAALTGGLKSLVPPAFDGVVRVATSPGSGAPASAADRADPTGPGGAGVDGGHELPADGYPAGGGGGDGGRRQPE